LALALHFRDFGAGTPLLQPAFFAYGRAPVAKKLQRGFDGFLA
jgi:hypothetical protein